MPVVFTKLLDEIKFLSISYYKFISVQLISCNSYSVPTRILNPTLRTGIRAFKTYKIVITSVSFWL